MTLKPRLAVSLAVALSLVAPGAGQAATRVAGSLTDGALPARAKGVALVHAVSPGSTKVLAGARVRRDGSYSLTVPPGIVAVIAEVVRRDRKVVSAITPSVRARSGRRTTMRVSLKRRRPVKPHRRARISAVADTASGAPPVAVKWFSGSGPWANLGPGLAEMVTTDLVDKGGKRCGMTVVEWNHRDLLQQEIDLQQKYKSLFDPSTLISKRWVEPKVFVQGKVTTTDDRISWDIQVVDAKTGAVLGGETKSVPADTVFDAEQQLADRLIDQLCPRRYEVTLDLRTTSTWPAVNSVGTVHSVVTAASDTTQAALGRWTGTGSLTYQDVSYTSGNPECTYVPEGSTTAPWTVQISGGGDGALTVKWVPNGDVRATAVVTCTVDGYTTSAGGQPGPTLQDPAPTSFTLPAGGGSQAIGGGIAIAGGGWSHSGTLTVKRIDASR